MLDDFGLIHMNGRIYDPEIGRFLSCDPYVQVPEFSQNFNRYSYVLNNPLTYTDPTGHKISEIWAAVIGIVVAAVAWYAAPLVYGALGASSAAGGLAAVGTNATWVSLVAQGAFVGAVTGGVNAAINGGNVGQGALTGAISGALGGLFSGVGNGILRMGAQATADGFSNKAMGGRFEDGFLSSLKFQFVIGIGLSVSNIVRSYMNGINYNGDGVTSRGNYMSASNHGYGYFDGVKWNPNPDNMEFMPGESLNDTLTGANASVYRRLSDGARIVNFVGTTGALWGKDWITNFLQGLGLKAPQYIKAIEYAKIQQARALAEGVDLVFVGHSLGGGLAMAARAVTGARAYVFNAATLNPATLRYAGYADRIPQMGANVTSYSVFGEVLTTVEFAAPFMPRMQAENVYLFTPKGPWDFWNAALYPIQSHRPAMSMAAFK